MKRLAVLVLLFAAFSVSAEDKRPVPPKLGQESIVWEMGDGVTAVMILDGQDKKAVLDKVCRGACSRNYLGEFWVVRKLK